jgi:hypothetical protein
MKTALSKSKYTKFCQCPKAMWLGKNKPEVATVGASVEARFAEGNVVGDLAMQLFGDFVEVTTMNGGRLDLTAMIEKTRELMAGNECNVICEASFHDGHCYTPAMGGSFRIKSVLPALFPNNDELNYHNLDTLAMVRVWEKLKEFAK